MEFTVFQQLFSLIDTATSSFVTEVSENVITAVTPVITAGMTLMFIVYGLLVARGAVDASIKDFVFRSFKIGIIVSIATSGGLYQSDIANAIQRTPDEFALAILPSQAGQAQDNTAATLVDRAASAGFDKASQAFANSGIFTRQGLAYIAFAILCVLATATLSAIGGAFILLAKVALALLSGLGPVFIFALLFKSTARFFEAWCVQVVTYGLLVVMMSSVFGLMMQIFTTYMNHVSFNSNFNFATSIGGCVILAIVCLLIIIQIPTIAGSLANGVGVGLWNELRIASGIGSSAARAGNAAAVAGGKAIGYGTRAAASGVSRAMGRFRGSGRSTA